MLKIQVEIKLTKDKENKQPRFILSYTFKREIKKNMLKQAKILPFDNVRILRVNVINFF